MVNLKALLDTRRQKSDGSFNIIFRITHNRKVYTLNSGFQTKELHWNDKRNEIDKSHPNAKILNLKITQQYFKIQQAILQLDDDFSMEQLRFMIDDNPKKQMNTTFKAFSDKLISQMIEVNRTGNAIVYQTALRYLTPHENHVQVK